ncbi:YbaK/EbsC family protein [Lentzea sp. BCCO 10_0856]|uniref:YbaK/EbsC family protein n=1 Tax=Lentzea miocenica TaxID=3095431 RepID=A0ABU4SUG8_9PSEU|nr:YbaK/EbsC family protein [Lentzea sp. BCCO 10_0856]MDX8029557.1 YbaK/EbsC family protein [Lentzea sp. BCCO 10_0856]
MSALEHPGIRKVADALPVATAGRIVVLPDAVKTAAAAAEAVGVQVGAIANSLLFAVVRDGVSAPLLVLTSGAHRADTSMIAELVGADAVKRANPEFVREHTGQVIGGVSPVGHPGPIETVVDRALSGYEEIWAAAGHPNAVYPTTFADLVALTGGRVAVVSV